MVVQSKNANVDIIIPVFNQLEYTKQCIEHILKYTDVPYNLIIVDNCSSDGTSQYLKGVDALVISNSENRGCAAAWNQGVRAGNGAIKVIMNND
ncbi:MAG: glycosyltransferase, partial [Candidatus Firestonebacteria bacterium]|nr:glycosyltransferase [Candidatus Firestonebacteria bacterium]